MSVRRLTPRRFAESVSVIVTRTFSLRCRASSLRPVLDSFNTTVLDLPAVSLKRTEPSETRPLGGRRREGPDRPGAQHPAAALTRDEHEAHGAAVGPDLGAEPAQPRRRRRAARERGQVVVERRAVGVSRCARRVRDQVEGIAARVLDLLRAEHPPAPRQVADAVLVGPVHIAVVERRTACRRPGRTRRSPRAPGLPPARSCGPSTPGFRSSPLVVVEGGRQLR